MRRPLMSPRRSTVAVSIGAPAFGSTTVAPGTTGHIEVPVKNTSAVNGNSQPATFDVWFYIGAHGNLDPELEQWLVHDKRRDISFDAGEEKVISSSAFWAQELDEEQRDVIVMVLHESRIVAEDTWEGVYYVRPVSYGGEFTEAPDWVEGF